MKRMTVRLIRSILVLACLAFASCGSVGSEIGRESVTQTVRSQETEPESDCTDEELTRAPETTTPEHTAGPSGGGILTGDPDAGAYTPYY